jgi:hypothetical protein
LKNKEISQATQLSQDILAMPDLESRHYLQAKIVVGNIGPWEEARPPAPPKGQARISMLTPSGLHFGQAPFDALAKDQLGGQVIATAMTLMHSLIEKAEKKA